MSHMMYYECMRSINDAAKHFAGLRKRILAVGSIRGRNMSNGFSFDIYTVRVCGTRSHCGEVRESDTGQRVHKTDLYRDEESAVNACLDWIDASHLSDDDEPENDESANNTPGQRRVEKALLHSACLKDVEHYVGENSHIDVQENIEVEDVREV